MTLPARTPSTVGHGPLDVLGEDVPAPDDDHVLDAAAHHELAVEQVGEVAGPQPLAVEAGLGGVGAVVVAGGHRRAPDLELADLAVRADLAGVRVADAQLEPGHRRAEQREPPGPVGAGRRPGPRSARSRARAGRRSRSRGRSTGLRERAADHHLGHAEGREDGARAACRGGSAAATKASDRVGIDGLGAVERDPQGARGRGPVALRRARAART